ASSIVTRERARGGRADDRATCASQTRHPARLIAQTLGRINLIAAHAHTRDARQRPFVDGEGDDQIFAAQSDALPDFSLCAPITEITIARFDRAPILFEYVAARVAASRLADERAEAEQARGLGARIASEIAAGAVCGA